MKEQNDEDAETEAMDDLSVENDDQLKGGPGGIYTITFGGSLSNHNETTEADEEAKTAALDDLAVEAGEEVKGGPLKRIRIGGMSFGEEGAE